MKAVVVKNNQFETVGFEVTENGKTLFTWGISPDSPFFWTKTVSTDKWISDIFELVRLEGMINNEKNFSIDFFKVALENSLIVEGQSVSFKANREKLENLEAKFENIIKNII